jgi:DNA repair exonuclease SbcCD ATPase subunit
LLVLFACAVAPLLAQEGATQTREGGLGELQREMRKFFADRLRAELDLTDEQMEKIMPKVQALEQEREAIRRERAETTRRLRGGLDGGTPDSELQELLERYDGVARKNLELAERLYGDIDSALTVRQRVRARFFMERFPRMMREKIEELRGGGGRGERGRAPYGRSNGERP